MKLPGTWLLAALLGCTSGPARAQLQPLPDQPPQRVFGGGASKIDVLWHNAGNDMINVDVSTRILQASSATTAEICEVPWKKLQVLPQQTVVESAQLDFPTVKAETKFLVQWIGASNQVLGLTEIRVYPTNLLGELSIIFKEADLGVLDANDELKPMLKQNGVAFLNLGERALEDFHGKLAVIGPFHPLAQMREGLAESLQKIAAAGVAVVWLQPPGTTEEIMPSFYVVPGTKAAVVVAQADLTAHFSDSPQSQLNLVRFCKLALDPKPFLMPNLASQP
ncbi:MAG: hypothetical protein P4N60_12490 [Verrucomicrobiae bacterium]|nr:hypothetical protein [Verrucomicrobiae bacterium]